MKKIVYFFAAGAMALTACNSEPSYKISGTVEGAEDGKVVYLQKQQGRELVKLDSAVVTNGKFTFSGRKDTAAVHYLTINVNEGKRYMLDFFLENGNITAILGQESSIKGTVCNDAYQAFKDSDNARMKEARVLISKFRNDSTLTEEQKEEIKQQVNAMNNEAIESFYNTIDANITNAVGAYMFPNDYSNFSLEQQKALIAKMSEEVKSDARISRIIKHIEVLEKTAVGQQFIDFEMPTPDGKTLKISDVVSKNKYTLIDFWASWCGPCRAEMPNVIAAYNEYNKKGFGIVGVSLDNDEAKWKAAIKEMKMPWAHMSDLKGWQCEGAALYGVNGIPATVLVAQDGTIVARNLRAEALKEKLAELLK